MVGMRDVAKKAGVSLSTVSLVVNGTGYVSEEMRARVEAAMRALNYVPNELARNLYTGRTNLVGILVPSIRHPFFSTLTAQIQHELSGRGLRTMLCSTADVATGEVEYVNMLRRRMMDGIVMCGHTSHQTGYWTSIGRPVVAFDRYLGEGIASVCSDHVQGGLLVADMLLKAGARSVVTIGGPLAQFRDLEDWISEASSSLSSGDFGTTFATVRYHLTLERELKAHGVRYEYVEAGEVDDIRGYAEAVRRVCDRVAAGEIDTVVSSDVGAAFCVQEALRRGIRIPQDLQVVAYDGTYLAGAAGMRLTAIRQDFEELGRLIADRMVGAIHEAGAHESAGGRTGSTAGHDAVAGVGGTDASAVSHGDMSGELRFDDGADIGDADGADGRRAGSPGGTVSSGDGAAVGGGAVADGDAASGADEDGGVVARLVGRIGDLVPVSVVKGETVRAVD